MRKFIISLIIAGLLLACVHYMLERRFTNLIRTSILPQLQERYRMEIIADSISMNLLSGSLRLRDVRIGNPPQFDEPDLARLGEIRIRLSLYDLWKHRKFTIRDLRVNRGEVYIIRNRHDRLNLAAAASASDQAETVATDAESSIPPAASPAAGTAGPTPDTIEPGGSSQITIQKARIRSQVYYIDHGTLFKPAGLQLDLDINLYAANLSNHGDAANMNGIVIMDGHIEVNGNRTPMELRGGLAPLLDPRRPTLELSGFTKSFDLLQTPPLCAWLGLERGKVACAVNIIINKGAIEPTRSLLKFDFTDVRSTPEARQRMQGINLPETFSLTMPLGGTLENPEIDFTTAVTRLLAGGDVIRSLLQNLYRAPGRTNTTPNPPASR
ncbi:MAG: hypothetical protein ABR497_00050 [Kiritimatiellia bacterium]